MRQYKLLLTQGICKRIQAEGQKGERVMKARPTRREFLKVTGTGLAGMTVLGVVGCGGGGSQSGNLQFASVYSAVLSLADDL